MLYWSWGKFMHSTQWILNLMGLNMCKVGCSCMRRWQNTACSSKTTVRLVKRLQHLLYKPVSVVKIGRVGFRCQIQTVVINAGPTLHDEKHPCNNSDGWRLILLTHCYTFRSIHHVIKCLPRMCIHVVNKQCLKVGAFSRSTWTRRRCHGCCRGKQVSPLLLRMFN